MKQGKLNLNPIIVKEFRSRMRGWRAFAILTVYLLFLAMFSYGVYRITLLSAPFGAGMPLSPFLGQALFAALVNLSLFFVVFLTPALTATAISSEHEKLTLEMLQATPLTSHTILFGKLISTASYIFLLLLAAVPMVSLVFIFGGVTVGDLLLAALVILSTAVTFGMLGLFFSAWRKRTIQAIVLSYVIILIFIGGTYTLYIFWGVMIQDFPPRSILLFNPFSALASVLSGGKSPQAGAFPAIFGVMAGGGPFLDDPAQLLHLRPLWHYTLAFYLLLTTGLYLLATRFIKPVRPWQLKGREMVGLILIAIFYLGAGTALFFKDIQRTINPPAETPTPTPVLGGLMRAAPVRPVETFPTPTPTAEATEEPEAETNE